MPLVRISTIKGAGPDGRKVGDIVYRAMVDTINVPEQDNFHIVTEHEPGDLVYDPAYLGIERSDGIVVIEVTLNQGRTTELKQAFYATVAQRLHERLGVRPQNVFISLTEVAKENWSFGNGEAQYA